MMPSMGAFTTHVLDTSIGRPAAGVAVELEVMAGGGWEPVGAGLTDEEGRLGDLLPEGTEPMAATYRIRFDSGGYFEARGVETFYPAVTIEFSVSAPGEHHHVPLLLSPFGYSTYRGS
jgi:5-hydroxyisourate hydrolase